MPEVPPASVSNTTLIIGATGAVGSQLARRLRQEGHHVVLAARNEETLRELAKELEADYVVCDATDPSSVRDAVVFADSLAAGLTGAVNCVGNVILKPADRTSDEEWQSTIALNLSSAFYLVREATKVMRASGGSIVLCSSAAARTGLVNHDAIAAVKAGVIGLMQSAAASSANRGIRINCVAPGLVDSAMTQSIVANDVSLKASVAMHPLGRIGTGQDVASAIAFLLDPSNSWVTGQVLGVDGGLGTLRSRITA